jgi:hypothetical protein
MGNHTPVQDAIRRALRKGNTTEPYPVTVGWEKIARDVYSRTYLPPEIIRNVRRVADRMPDVSCALFRKSGRPSGAYFNHTPAQQWFSDRVREKFPGARYLSDCESYHRVTREEVTEVFIEGCREEGSVSVELLRDVIVLANKHGSVYFEPSEIIWWRVGLEEAQRQEREALLQRMSVGLRGLAPVKERRELEARIIESGPFRIDPAQVTECPLCHQQVQPGTFPAQRAGAQVASTP